MRIIKKIIICCLVMFSFVSLINISSFYSFGATASSKTGFCYIKISGDGYTTYRKIKITLSSTNLSKAQNYTLSEQSISRIF